MGVIIAKLFSRLHREARIAMVGLDNAGKTTSLYKMKLGEVVHTIPTVGFNVDTVEYKRLSMTVWDIGGQKKLRPLWRHYFSGCKGLIYVVDSSDVDRLEEAGEELLSVLEEPELRGAAVLVLANKQDLPCAASASDVAKGLGLPSLRSHQWYVQPCIATIGEGLWEGMDWLVETLNKRD